MKYFLASLIFATLAFSNCTTTEKKNTETVKQKVEQKTVANHDAKSKNKQGISPSKSTEAKKLPNEYNKYIEDKKTRFDVKYKVLNAGTNPNIGTFVIRSKKELANLNKNRSRKFLQEAGEIDFNKQAIVVVSGGKFATGGFSVHLVSAILNEKNLSLNFCVKGPKPTDIVTQAFTYPYLAVLVEVDKFTKININLIGASMQNNLMLQ